MGETVATVAVAGAIFSAGAAGMSYWFWRMADRNMRHMQEMRDQTSRYVDEIVNSEDAA